MLVVSWGSGVHGFTLDTTVGEFVLTHPNIQIPQRGERVLSSVSQLPAPPDIPETEAAHCVSSFAKAAMQRNSLCSYGGTFCIVPACAPDDVLAAPMALYLSSCMGLSTAAIRGSAVKGM